MLTRSTERRNEFLVELRKEQLNSLFEERRRKVLGLTNSQANSEAKDPIKNITTTRREVMIAD